jgi:hypothetical protein
MRLNCLRIVVLLMLSSLLAACGPYEYRLPDTGATLEGTITYAGEKVPLAQINVLSEKGQGIGVVEEDGRYLVTRAPLGEVKIGVNTEAMRSQAIGQQMAQSYKGPGAKAAGRAAAVKFISLPAKYQDPETSGITTTIKSGKNTFDIVLTPGGK